jgi:hypothetical protein
VAGEARCVQRLIARFALCEIGKSPAAGRGVLSRLAVARKLLTYRHQLVASPAYLGTREPPEKPQDLLRHRLIAFSYWRPESSWTFVHANGRDRETLTFQPALSMNDFAGLTPALLAGGGIGDLPPVV